MKRKIFICAVLFCILTVLTLIPACSQTASGDTSLKSITKPYIGEYECVEARLGQRDLLEKYDFIVINLLDGEKMEVSFKPKDGKKKTYEGSYEVSDTREFTGEIGILGVRFKETTKIENGSFIITKNIMSSPLILKFKMK